MSLYAESVTVQKNFRCLRQACSPSVPAGCRIELVLHILIKVTLRGQGLLERGTDN